jgi:suppressor of ftsI
MTPTGKRPHMFGVVVAVIWASVVITDHADAVQGSDVAHTHTRALPVSQGCTSRTDAVQPAPRQYSIELVPGPGIAGGTGRVSLTWAPSPFGVSVSPDGHMVYSLTLVLNGLPAPRTLGPYDTYVAWVAEPLFGTPAAYNTTPEVRDYADRVRWTFRSEQKLGVVANGATDCGPVALDKFLVLITAEESGSVSERRGYVVFRGYSPSTRLQAGGHTMLSAGLQFDPDRLPPVQESGPVHAHDHMMWGMVPPNPALPMIMGPQMLSPAVMPFLPPRKPEIAPAKPWRRMSLRDGDTLRLEAGPVLRKIGAKTFVMYGFNGQYPGPLIDVAQNTTLNVVFTNNTDLPSAIHWHGVRVANANDGAAGLTQALVPPGGTFVYRVRMPDAGVYWYHPHHREDIQQGLGLYGNIIVRSPRADFFGPANREEFMMLGDVLIGANGLFPFGREAANDALMGRIGNTLLINGSRDYRLSVRAREVVRFFLTNASNARTFNFSFGSLPVKVVASDVGKFEREVWTRSVVIAPAERYVVEVQFPDRGTVLLTNRIRAVNHLFGTFYGASDTLGVVTVRGDPVKPDYTASHKRLRVNSDVIADLDRYRKYFERPPDHTLLITLDQTRLPRSIVQSLELDTAYFHPIEWDRTMPMMNGIITSNQARWVLRDTDTGLENMAIRWRFRVGDVAKIRLRNDRSALHAMQHPIHIHGQRFLVLARNGVRNSNLVWKDTALIPAGETVDILLDLSNPGKWMLHCHIAEHLESGMMMAFEVR